MYYQRLFTDNVDKDITNDEENFWLQKLQQLNQGFRPERGESFNLCKDSHPHNMELTWVYLYDNFISHSTSPLQVPCSETW
jgi:hypothetical protein